MFIHTIILYYRENKWEKLRILKEMFSYLLSYIVQDIENSSIERLNELISQILLIQREEDIYDILNTTQLA